MLGSKRGSGKDPDPARHSANDGNTKQAQWISCMSKFILQKIQPAGETCGSQTVAGSLWQLVTLSNKTLLVVMYHPWPYRYQLTYHCYLLRGMPQISPLKGLFNNDPSPTLSGIYSVFFELHHSNLSASKSASQTNSPELTVPSFGSE